MKLTESHIHSLKFKLGAVIIGALIALSGCNNGETLGKPAAPLGDVSALEKLAEAYREISDEFPVNPVNLAPDVRKKFVKKVFSSAGYGYEETLSGLSKISRQEITELHRDMQKLLFLPHYRVGKEVWNDIYSDEEIQLIKEIESNFN